MSNGNIKFLGIIIILLAAMFAYEKYEAISKENQYLKQISEGSPKLRDFKEGEIPKENINTVVNNEFGYSFKIPHTLKFMIKNIDHGSMIASKNPIENPKDIIIVSPSIDSEETFASQLSIAGYTIQNNETYVRASSSQNGSGLDINIIFRPSIGGGGIVFTKMQREDTEPSISEDEFLSVVNNTSIVAPSYSIENRRAIIAQQNQNQQQKNQNSDYQRKLDAIKRDGVFSHGMHEINSVGDN